MARFAALFREECDNRIESQRFCGVDSCASVGIFDIQIHAEFDGDFHRFEGERFAFAAFNDRPGSSSATLACCSHHCSCVFPAMFKSSAAAALNDFIGMMDEQRISAVLDKHSHDLRRGESRREPERCGADQFRFKMRVT